MKQLQTLYQNYKRVARHRRYLYDRILETRNKCVRILLRIDCSTNLEIQKKSRKRKYETKKYFICRVAEDDIHLLSMARKYLLLTQKYKRKLKYLNL